MPIVGRALRFVNGFLKSYGPSKLKRHLWDEEFSVGKWNFIDDTSGDCVYPYLEQYIANGSILDLGCGPGNTANELAANAYQTYVGLDISQAALDKAARRTENNGRAGKNSFVQGDFLSYVPTRSFDVILFRESMYHVPIEKIKGMLNRYSKYLADGGVFIVRMSAYSDGEKKFRPTAMLHLIESGFDVVENCRHGVAGPTVIVFRAK